LAMPDFSVEFPFGSKMSTPKVLHVAPNTCCAPAKSGAKKRDSRARPLSVCDEMRCDIKIGSGVYFTSHSA
jgi:hypothetical protein